MDHGVNLFGEGEQRAPIVDSDGNVIEGGEGIIAYNVPEVVADAQGNAVMVPVLDANGNAVLDEHGEQVMKPEVKMRQTADRGLAKQIWDAFSVISPEAYADPAQGVMNSGLVLDYKLRDGTTTEDYATFRADHEAGLAEEEAKAQVAVEWAKQTPDATTDMPDEVQPYVGGVDQVYTPYQAEQAEAEATTGEITHYKLPNGRTTTNRGLAAKAWNELAESDDENDQARFLEGYTRSGLQEFNLPPQWTSNPDTGQVTIPGAPGSQLEVQTTNDVDEAVKQWTEFTGAAKENYDDDQIRNFQTTISMFYLREAGRMAESGDELASAAKLIEERVKTIDTPEEIDHAFNEIIKKGMDVASPVLMWGKSGTSGERQQVWDAFHEALGVDAEWMESKTSDDFYMQGKHGQQHPVTGFRTSPEHEHALHGTQYDKIFEHVHQLSHHLRGNPDEDLQRALDAFWRKYHEVYGKSALARIKAANSNGFANADVIIVNGGHAAGGQEFLRNRDTGKVYEDDALTGQLRDTDIVIPDEVIHGDYGEGDWKGDLAALRDGTAMAAGQVGRSAIESFLPGGRLITKGIDWTAKQLAGNPDINLTEAEITALAERGITPDGERATDFARLAHASDTRQEALQAQLLKVIPKDAKILTLNDEDWVPSGETPSVIEAVRGSLPRIGAMNAGFTNVDFGVPSPKMDNRSIGVVTLEDGSQWMQPWPPGWSPGSGSGRDTDMYVNIAGPGGTPGTGEIRVGKRGETLEGSAPARFVHGSARVGKNILAMLGEAAWSGEHRFLDDVGWANKSLTVANSPQRFAYDVARDFTDLTARGKELPGGSSPIADFEAFDGSQGDLGLEGGFFGGYRQFAVEGAVGPMYDFSDPKILGVKLPIGVKLTNAGVSAVADAIIPVTAGAGFAGGLGLKGAGLMNRLASASARGVLQVPAHRAGGFARIQPVAEKIVVQPVRLAGKGVVKARNVLRDKILTKPVANWYNVFGKSPPLADVVKEGGLEVVSEFMEEAGMTLLYGGTHPFAPDHAGRGMLGKYSWNTTKDFDSRRKLILGYGLLLGAYAADNLNFGGVARGIKQGIKEGLAARRMRRVVPETEFERAEVREARVAEQHAVELEPEAFSVKEVEREGTTAKEFVVPKVQMEPEGRAFITRESELETATAATPGRADIGKPKIVGGELEYETEVETERVVAPKVEPERVATPQAEAEVQVAAELETELEKKRTTRIQPESELEPQAAQQVSVRPESTTFTAAPAQAQIAVQLEPQTTTVRPPVQPQGTSRSRAGQGSERDTSTESAVEAQTARVAPEREQEQEAQTAGEREVEQEAQVASEVRSEQEAQVDAVSRVEAESEVETTARPSAESEFESTSSAQVAPEAEAEAAVVGQVQVEQESEAEPEQPAAEQRVEQESEAEAVIEPGVRAGRRPRRPAWNRNQSVSKRRLRSLRVSLSTKLR